MAGVDGTLTNHFRDSRLKGKLWAKTGTLKQTVALSGYLTAASGKTLAFSVMVEWPSAGEQRGERGSGANLRGDCGDGVKRYTESTAGGSKKEFTVQQNILR